jgi:tetratricopeptide (TPR) repeat protein
VEQARRQLETDPSDVRALCLGGSALVGLGEGDAGREWIERARTVAPDDAVTLYYAAGVYARTGAREAALDALERAVRLGFRHARWAELDRDLDGLRRSARYRALVAGAPAGRRHPGPRPSA